MKKGFALLETIIVITFLAVSLLLLYNTFVGMVNNSKRNVLFDDVSDIYKAYYLKEYLINKNIELNTNDIKELTCTDLNFNSCNNLFKELDINKIYIVKYDLKEYDNSLFSSVFNDYINSLSNKDNYKYRLILEFKSDRYASIGIGDNYE